MAYDGGVEGWRARGLERNLRTQRTEPVSAHRKQGSLEQGENVLEGRVCVCVCVCAHACVW